MRDATQMISNSLNASKFQSTRPMRDATNSGRTTNNKEINFNPRVPCGTRPDMIEVTHSSHNISIHASHAGRDLISFKPILLIILFQSTRPMRDATSSFRLALCFSKFQSTRPMRDATIPSIICSLTTHHFNPRVPCGTRRD